jgi:transposase
VYLKVHEQRKLRKVKFAAHSNIKVEILYLLADKAYDSDAIIEKAKMQGMEVVIPPKSNRKVQRKYDKEIYKLRHLVKNAFLNFKQ